ncbi:MAG: leucine--tRNA ligase [Gemmatimonadota bacterium]|nr:MAG: leucine--tRNA ligase [Gemmatimonadota bacterium]
METQGVREVWADGARWPFAAIEKKWQERWEQEKTFRTPEQLDDRPKFYALVMFPYPSGSGLHVGHPESYVAADILARAKRMMGFRVLHPMGFDSFGLPAEQYAVQTGTHPRVTTKKNVDTFRRQIRSLGLSYDWEREVRTSDPAYYRWTQWIFLRLFDSWYDEEAARARPMSELPIPPDVQSEGEAAVRRYRDSERLAYQAEVAVNWCQELGTVLSNEEVIDGKSERGDHPVTKLPLKQWMLRITKYADRLLADLDDLDWPEPLKMQQRNWIGKSTGAEMDFPSAATATTDRGGVFPREVPENTIRVYTTRPDTVFGVTFMVLSPEHPLVDHFTTDGQRAAVDEYRQAAAHKSDLERTDLAKDKTGVDTGGFVVNPATGENVPVWIADYVLMGYGTGAIMAVPGHDVRDQEFAEAMGLEIRPILEVAGEALPAGEDSPDARYVRSTGPGVSLDGLDIPAGKQAAVDWLVNSGHGTAASNTKLRDWLFSRQRYWGEPIPILHDEQGNMVAVPDSELPVVLPEIEDFQPTGRPEPLLSKATEWIAVTDASGKQWSRETNTMPQWAGSCWYYLRYIDPHNESALVDPALERAWMPADVYIGGAEHAVLHLLYARFWHKVLFDLGHVSTREPFQKLMNQGMILGENNEKMSKSRGNVINPDDVVNELGADALRLYEMFMGPLEVDKPWSTKGIHGISRFLDRAWRAAQFAAPESGDPHARERHRTIRKVGEDIERVRFNTAISAMMEYVNALTKAESATDEDKRVLTLLVSPFAPHWAEEVWSRLGHGESLAYESWPTFDPELAKAEMLTIVVQVNGKVRSTFEVEPDTPKDDVERLALADETVLRHLEGRPPRKVIVVPGRLVNIVV